MSTRERDQEREFSFHIHRHLGVLANTPKGWTKELNVVSFNEMPARYDIRDWDQDHKKMSRGITMTKEEILSLRKLLTGLSADNEGNLFVSVGATAGEARGEAALWASPAPAAATEAALWASPAPEAEAEAVLRTPLAPAPAADPSSEFSAFADAVAVADPPAAPETTTAI